MASSVTMAIPDERQAKLRRSNVIAGVFHLIQAIAILAMANSFALPVTAHYLQDAPRPGARFATIELFSFPMAYGVAAFSLLSALAHGWIATWGFRRYIDDLAHKRNIARWIEYALSSTLMIVLIAMLNSVWDVVALLALAGVNVSMILFGWLQERYEEPGRGSLLPFWFGCIAGSVPWIAFFFLLVAPGNTAEPPGFVYAIVFSLFVFFNGFALVQWLQYRQVGRFADYLAGERLYIVLSFVAKTALAWQIFGGVLGTSAAG